MTASIFETVTAKIIAALEAGVAPWSRPWGSAKGSFTMPTRVTGESYTGINIVLLWSAQAERGYTSAQWMTFKQASDLGGHVRRGERGTQIVYYSTFTKEDDDGNEKAVPFLKTYTVFNVEQIDSLPARFYTKALPIEGPSPIASAQSFFDAVGADVRHGGDRAFYSPSQDFVQMPVLQAFRDAEAYYCTLGHELVHRTGAESRLARTFGKRFGDQAYASEELVAELGAAFLSAMLGLAAEPRADHAQYLGSWLKVLKADSRAIFTAASMAQKAVDHIRAEAEAGAAIKIAA